MQEKLINFSSYVRMNAIGDGQFYSAFVGNMIFWVIIDHL